MKHRITFPRIHHIALLGILALFVVATLTGAMHLIALGALVALVLFTA